MRLLILALLLSISDRLFGAEVIDARGGVNRDVIAQYQSIIANSSSTHKHIVILISANKGFDVGILRLPGSARRVVVRFTVKVFGFGGSAQREISFSNFDLVNTRNVFEINQSVYIY